MLKVDKIYKTRHNVVYMQSGRKRKKKRKALPVQEAEVLINRLAQESGNVFIEPGAHGEDQCNDRDFTRKDVLELLRRGKINNSPRFEKGRWRYKLEISGYRGRPYGAAAVAIIQEPVLIVVTVMWLDK